MKELFMGFLAAALLGGAFAAGRLWAPPAPAVNVAPRAQGALQAPPLAASLEPAQKPIQFNPGEGATLSLYNPTGRLLRHFELRGSVSQLPMGELMFDTTDGHRVRTNATYVLEGPIPASAPAESMLDESAFE